VNQPHSTVRPDGNRTSTRVIVHFLQGETATEVAFNYRPNVLAALKTIVPEGARSWSPARKRWTVRNFYVPSLVAAFGADGCQVIHRHVQNGVAQ
jgi:hypothetical protein